MKKIITIIFIFLSIFALCIPFYAIQSSNTDNDNWELELNYCNKNGIITERNIEWDASDGGYLQSEEKEIIIQVNYVNRDIQKEYKPGDITINVKNLMYKAEDSNISYDVSIAANTQSQTGYKWNYISNENPKEAEFLTFSNVEEIVSNIEGSFQIRYLIKYDGDNGKRNFYDEMKYYPEKFEDSCYKSFSSSSYATLNDSYRTDDISIETEREYYHPWEYQKFTIEETPIICENIPRDIVENINDYIWVGYKYNIPECNFEENIDEKSYEDTYPYYRNLNWKIKTKFEDCIVFDQNYNQIDNNVESDNFRIIAPWGEISKNFIYVGYPKDIYNEENDNYVVKSNVDLYVEHEYLGEIYHDSDESTINLGDFMLNYDGDGYEISINMDYHNEKTIYYECLSTHNDKIGGNRSTWWKMPIKVKVTDQETDVIIGLDTILITDENSEYKILEDDEYYLKYFNFPNIIYDGFGRQIPANTYDCELYVRERGEKTYKLYDTFKNPSSNRTYGVETGKQEKIVGYYFKIKGLKNGILTEEQVPDLPNTFTFTLDIDNAKIAKQGNFLCFNYLKVYDKYGNLINNKKLENYEKLAQTIIAPLDLKNHGCYIQRALDKVFYVPFENFNPNIQLSTKKDMQITFKDEENEVFKGTANIHLTKGDTYAYYNNLIDYLYLMDDSKKIKGFEMWDLLPYGMKLESSVDDIKESIIGPASSYYHIIYNDIPVWTVTEELKNACVIEINDNWNNTGRTWIHIKFDIGDNTIVLNPYYKTEVDYLSLKYDFSISYESFMESSTYRNDLYADWYINKFNLKNPIADNGAADKDALDINMNGNIDEKFSHAFSNVNIDAIIACQQNIKKSVSTDKSNFTTDIVESSLDTEYKYKISVTTGPAQITNFIIYDNIEMEFGNNKHWKGEFLGIDTSYAESKGYKIKVYYSENERAGNLADDSSWKIYDDTVDKSKVKSLAFEYLDKDGNPAKLPANSLTYVIIKMKSPKDYSKYTSYNSSRSTWNAIDDYGNVIDKIVGLKSNIVNVTLNKPVGREVNLNFNKTIINNDNSRKLNLDSNSSYNFLISLKNQETGDIINGVLNSKDGFYVNNIPVGTYIISEKNDIWFSFVSMTLAEPIDGIELKEENGTYIITIEESVESGTIANIEVKNKTDYERFYNRKYDISNIFNN